MEIWLWIGFIAFVLGMLFLDLFVLNRKPHEIRTRDAVMFSGICAGLALAFNVLIYFMYEHHWLGMGTAPDPDLGGREAALQFFTGWVIEQSLSLDNIFVIATIFTYFGVELRFQHRTLFWGIIGALVMRAAMILGGAGLINIFWWTEYLFGALLLFTAWKMYRAGDEPIDPNSNVLVKLARKIYPVSGEFEGERFFTRVEVERVVVAAATDEQGGIATTEVAERVEIGLRRAITPLFLVLLVIESTDVLFAIDSIPAVFAITTDSFIVFTSNVFAILNLRSLYFALASLLDRFKYLKPSLVIVLAFVGLKMLLHELVHVPTTVSLGLILAILLGGVLVSMVARQRAGGNRAQ